MIGKRYSAEFKRMMVEEYLSLQSSNPKLSKSEFAYNKGLPDSTFNDWVVKYNRQGLGFCNITTEIKKLDGVELVDSSPIHSSLVKEIKDETMPMSVNKVRMKYNGAVIEFDESLLERALNILKTW
jgi:transposase-like protein